MKYMYTFSMFLIVFVACASIPRYTPPELPKITECELVVEKVVESLNKARDALQDVPGKIVYFGNRVLSITCLEKNHAIVNVMIDAVIKIEEEKAPYVCISTLFVIEGKINKDGAVDHKLLNLYVGDEVICDFEEENK